MDSSSEQETPRSTPAMAGTDPQMWRRKDVNSSGSMTPAASHIVTVVAPASMAALRISQRKLSSLRVASSARNSTSGQRARQAATVSLTAFSMASGFLWKRYSIWTGLTGAWTWRRGFFASFRAFQVICTFSGERATGTATMLPLTAAATDLTRRLSIFGCSMGSSSMTDAPRRSRSLASSIFSRKDREKSTALPVCFMVTSLIRIVFISVLLLWFAHFFHISL